MRVTVMNRAQAVSYCHKRHDRPAVMISISDPYEERAGRVFCSPQNMLKSILRLRFADADRPGPDVYGREASALDMMQDEDAARIAAQIYDLARLAHKPLTAEEMTAFIKRSAEILEIAAK